MSLYMKLLGDVMTKKEVLEYKILMLKTPVYKLFDIISNPCRKRYNHYTNQGIWKKNQITFLNIAIDTYGEEIETCYEKFFIRISRSTKTRIVVIIIDTLTYAVSDDEKLTLLDILDMHKEGIKYTKNDN